MFLLSKFRCLNFDLSYFRCQLRYRFTQYLILKVSLVLLRKRQAIGVTNILIICYSILKTAILLHKRGLVKTEVLSTVCAFQTLNEPLCAFQSFLIYYVPFRRIMIHWGVVTPEPDLGLQKLQGLNDFSPFLLTFLGDSKNEVRLPLSLLVQQI